MVLFYYKSTPYLHINEMSVVIGQFNNFDTKTTPMERRRDGWYVEIDLPKGEHSYKFVIDDILVLNDPNATLYLQDDEGEVWSIVEVDSKGEQVTGEYKGTVSLLDHVITNRTREVIEEARYKNSFNLNMDSTVVAGFELGNIRGIHTITAVWVTPLLYMHHISDHIIEVKEGDENDATDIWFWIDLKDKEREYPYGLWSIKLFINGDFVMEDRFNIGAGGTYQATPKGIFINQNFNVEV